MASLEMMTDVTGVQGQDEDEKGRREKTRREAGKVGRDQAPKGLSSQ